MGIKDLDQEKKLSEKLFLFFFSTKKESCQQTALSLLQTTLHGLKIYKHPHTLFHALCLT